MVERFDAWTTALGPWGYGFLLIAAVVEYVFPPFPGDSVVLLGGMYVARGQRSWALVLLAVTTGSILGAALDYWAGLRLGARMDAGQGGRLARLRQVQTRMTKSGNWLILVNRFLPGVRALIFVAAGAARLPLPRVLALGAVSALAFNGAVLALGIALGGNAERLEGLFEQYQQGMYALLGLAALALLVRWLAQRKASEGTGARP